MLPCHIAIIMDGNGRWARMRKLPRAAGHTAGMETVRTIVHHAANIGVKWLTLYAFSSENWARPADEVQCLLSLLKLFIHRDLADLHENNVRVRVIGERDNLAGDIVALLQEAETLTAENTGLNLVVAFNYGGRNEIVRAVKKIAAGIVSGTLAESDINDRLLASCLDTAQMPDPDLIIRTSGEMRLSNFLLWQAAYAEFSFVSCFWPDFSVADFDAAIASFYARERRFGNLKCSSDDIRGDDVRGDDMRGVVL